MFITGDVNSRVGSRTDQDSDETPEEVIRLEPDFLSEVGITQHLSPNRRNGLTGVREKIKAYAQMQLERTE